MATSSATLSFLAPAGKHPQKPLFVYLPGMDGSGQLFHLQIPDLQPHFDLRCVAISPDALSSWEDMAAQVVTLIRQEASPQPIYLCGESFGACLALHVVAQAPTLASHLILINSASSFYRFPWLHWVANLTPWVLPPLYQTSALGSLPILANLSRIHPDHHTALLRAMRAVSQTSTAWRLGLLSQFRLDALERSLQRCQTDTLIIASQADRLLPSMEEAQRLASVLPNPCIYPLPHSGHVSLLEDGISLGKILAAVNFLSRPNRDAELVAS